jgi:four helix bundle protein
MLRVIDRYLEWLRSFRHVVDAIDRRDRKLGSQLREAAGSVGLNHGEGSGSEGGTRRQRYLSALGSAREVYNGLRVADALGYVAVPEAVTTELHNIIGIIVSLAKPRGC